MKQSYFGKRSEPSMVEVSCIHIEDKDTRMAYAVDTGERDENDKVIITWLPKSQCSPSEESKNTFMVPEWLATQKGLI